METKAVMMKGQKVKICEPVSVWLSTVKGYRVTDLTGAIGTVIEEYDKDAWVELEKSNEGKPYKHTSGFLIPKQSLIVIN